MNPDFVGSRPKQNSGKAAVQFSVRFLETRNDYWRERKIMHVQIKTAWRPAVLLVTFIEASLLCAIAFELLSLDLKGGVTSERPLLLLQHYLEPIDT